MFSSYNTRKIKMINKIKECPVCGNTNIRIQGETENAVDGWCEKCNTKFTERKVGFEK